MKNNISNIKQCYGCGVCTIACAKKIIEIKLNRDGFYEPQLTDPEKCTNCGLCVDVCSFSHKELPLQNEESTINSWAAWSNDEQIQRKCSSGGIGFEIAKQLIQNGYKLCGCRYNADKNRAEHYIATTTSEAIESIGSKYIQSYTADAFKAINRKEKYLVTGTPCQIDSFRRYIRKFHVEGNFVLLDFFCHCVPSMLAWNKYTKMVEKQTGKITYASWRNKLTGWHDSWAMAIDGENSDTKNTDPSNNHNKSLEDRKTAYYSLLSKGDIFYNLFLGDYCHTPACEKNCKYKYKQSSADIRIGDLWGKTYKENEKGVSALVSYTKKGAEIIEELKDVTLIEHPFEIIAEGQMKRNVHKAPTYSLVMYFLKSKIGFDSITWRILHFVNRVAKKLYNIFK